MQFPAMLNRSDGFRRSERLLGEQIHGEGSIAEREFGEFLHLEVFRTRFEFHEDRLGLADSSARKSADSDVKESVNRNRAICVHTSPPNKSTSFASPEAANSVPVTNLPGRF